LPATIDVCAIQLPGREERLGESAFRDLDPLLDALLDATAREPALPFVVFGHSVGALIAFEWARRLRRAGLPGPVHLIVSGRAAPQVPRRRPPIYDLPEPEFREQWRQLNGTPAELFQDEEFMQLVSPTLRADFTLSEAHPHREEPPLDCPITALGGVDDVWNVAWEVEAWRPHTSRQFQCRQFAGDHFFVKSAEAEVLAYLAPLLRAAERSR
jgi:medium-chain acyl-[acyl-carrier-protein] hydrolase